MTFGNGPFDEKIAQVSAGTSTTLNSSKSKFFVVK